MAVAKDEAKILTKLFESKSEEITLSKLSRIFKTNFALLSPFLIFNNIRGLDVAVNAVSEPDKNPDKTIKTNKKESNSKVIKDI